MESIEKLLEMEGLVETPEQALKLSEQETEYLLSIKPEELSETEFDKISKRDNSYMILSREKFVSPLRTIDGRVKATLQVIQGYPYFRTTGLQVWLGDEKELIHGIPETEKERLSGENVLVLPLNSSGELIVKHDKPLTKYEEFILKRHAKTLVLHVKSADDYEQNLERAIRDGLTGLYNYRYFDHQLEDAFTLEQTNPTEHGLSLTYLDIDLFKKINDKYGHLAGDQILVELSNLMKKSIRDQSFRIGGEEFAVISPNASLEIAKRNAEALRRVVMGKTFYYNKIPIPVSISAGISHYPHQDVIDKKRLTETADNTLYRAKNNGRNRVEIY
ncbi:GGDEF domain-containing protein [Candidatus Woesearchaeota archaeon]|nr:GGDEF domain-containing protein [Candidatus Woesearchaeota archaeon]